MGIGGRQFVPAHQDWRVTVMLSVDDDVEIECEPVVAFMLHEGSPEMSPIPILRDGAVLEGRGMAVGVHLHEPGRCAEQPARRADLEHYCRGAVRAAAKRKLMGDE